METCSPIRRFQLVADAWTPIVAPIDCAFYAILGTSDNAGCFRSSDPNNAEAWHQLSGSYAFIVPAAKRHRWLEGDVVTYLKAVSSPDVAIVEFIPA